VREDVRVTVGLDSRNVVSLGCLMDAGRAVGDNGALGVHFGDGCHDGFFLFGRGSLRGLARLAQKTVTRGCSRARRHRALEFAQGGFRVGKRVTSGLTSASLAFFVSGVFSGAGEDSFLVGGGISLQTRSEMRINSMCARGVSIEPGVDACAWTGLGGPVPDR